MPCGNKIVYANQAAVTTAISIRTTDPAMLLLLLADWVNIWIMQ